MQSGVKGTNLFEYCDNNVVNKADPTGHWPKWMRKWSIPLTYAPHIIDFCLKSIVAIAVFNKSLRKLKSSGTGFKKVVLRAFRKAKVIIKMQIRKLMKIYILMQPCKCLKHS